MAEIKTKRVYEQEYESDGFRVLVDKLWPRGIKKENLHYDLWAKDITPSTELRQWYHKDMKNRWKEFKQRYTEELEESSAVRTFVDAIKKEKVVTLLYAAKDVKQNHAIILQQYLEKIVK